MRKYEALSSAQKEKIRGLMPIGNLVPCSDKSCYRDNCWQMPPSPTDEETKVFYNKIAKALQ